jgi:23S rRNA (pseudouridine1915-N3)-methyltransferase
MAYMKITILAIGKKHDPKLLSAIEDYSKRLSHYTTLEWKLLEAKITPSMAEDEIRTIESRVLSNAIPEASTVVLLDERGTELNSPALAQKFQNFLNTGTRNLVLIIGGAYGVSETVTQRADFVWSLSKLVFPHQLVRLIVSEQIYRAHTILAGEKYHHQ